MQPLFNHLYRNSSRKSTPKRTRLEFQQSQPKQKSALYGADIITLQALGESRPIPADPISLVPPHAHVPFAFVT